MIFEIMLREVAAKHPTMSVTEAIKAAEAMERGEDPSTILNATPVSMSAEHIADWLFANAPSVVDWIKADKMIFAIKDARAFVPVSADYGYSCLGLKEAKEAVEYLKYKIMGYDLPAYKKIPGTY